MDPRDIITSLERNKENCTSFAEINRLDYIIQMVSQGMDYNRKVLEVFLRTKLATKIELSKRGLLSKEVEQAIDEVRL